MLTIRKIEEKDYDRIAILIIQEFSKSPYNDKWTKKEALGSIKSDLKKGQGFVALENNQVVGFILFTKEKIDKTYIFIENLVVDEKYQKKGIGRKLVQEVENKIKEGILTLSVNKKSKAYNFYKKMRFKENKINVNMSKRLIRSSKRIPYYKYA
ncbi:GNAT family N-acetyltransferase [Candidatus Pacearchaeota archaeon]|nr:GNAT family N-acetyltransferase [Candidatus Pacearchaeota archaeon]